MQQSLVCAHFASEACDEGTPKEHYQILMIYHMGIDVYVTNPITICTFSNKDCLI